MNRRSTRQILLFVGIFAALQTHAMDGVVRVFHTGGTMDHDYFDQQPGTKQIVASVEINHLYSHPSNPQGVMGDIAAGRYQYAIRELIYTLERVVNHPRALQLMGTAGKLAGETNLPIAYFERALKFYPQHAITHAQYGAYLADIGRVDDGIARLKQSVEMDPELAAGYAWLAKAYAKSGQSALADQTAARARELGYRPDAMRLAPKN